MKQSVNAQGYLTCNLGKRKVTVHRLVALAFIPNPNNYPVVDHIDGNKLNNNVSNLRWCTHKENTRAAYELGIIKKPERGYCLSIDKEGNGILYQNQAQAAKANNIDFNEVGKCVRGINKQYKGKKYIKLKTLLDLRTEIYEEE